MVLSEISLMMPAVSVFERRSAILRRSSSGRMFENSESKEKKTEANMHVASIATGMA